MEPNAPSKTADTCNIHRRDYSHFDADKFKYDVKSLHLDQKLTNLSSTNDKYNYFHNELLSTINKHAPLVKLSKRKRKNNKKPWISKGILRSIRIKNKYYSRFISSNDNQAYQKYKQYRNKINHLIRLSKKNHYLNYFHKFKGNMNKTWQGIKSHKSVILKELKLLPSRRKYSNYRSNTNNK